MEWNTIVREVRVLQRDKLKDQSAKNRADKEITKFEKIWRKKTGIKTTSNKGGKGKKKKASKKKPAKPKEPEETKEPEIKQKVTKDEWDINCQRDNISLEGDIVTGSGSSFRTVRSAWANRQRAFDRYAHVNGQ